MNFTDYYKILGLSEFASTDEIKKSFRELAKKYHPDKNKASDANEKFREIFEAYEILINPADRKHFDQKRKEYYSANKQEIIKQYFSDSQFDSSKKQAKEKADHFSKMTFDDFLKSSLFIAKKATMTTAIILMFLFGAFMILFSLYSVTITTKNVNGTGFFIMLFGLAFGGLLIYIAQKDYKKINQGQ
jgi:curved DNA-binding protein CbpA